MTYTRTRNAVGVVIWFVSLTNHVLAQSSQTSNSNVDDEDLSDGSGLDILVCQKNSDCNFAFQYKNQ